MSLGSSLTGRSEIGEPYMVGVTSLDGRFEDDLKAIDEYVRTTARSRITQFPDSIKQIQAYEEWRLSVPWYSMAFLPNDVMATAKNKLAAVNKAQESILKPDTQVEPGAFITPPADPEKKVSLVTQVAIGVGVGLVGAILIVLGVSKLNPVSTASRIVKRF
jgi:hypothetical protein